MTMNDPLDRHRPQVQPDEGLHPFDSLPELPEDEPRLFWTVILLGGAGGLWGAFMGWILGWW